MASTFATHINTWVRLESEIHALMEKIAVLRKERETEAATIIEAVRARGLSKAVLKLKTCSVHMSTNNVGQTLSYGMLEGLLRDYFASMRQPDQTVAIIKYIKTHRTHKITSRLDLHHQDASVSMSEKPSPETT